MDASRPAPALSSAVVHGATGYVGRHLVRGLLAEGATVLAVGRSAARLDALRESAGDDGTRLVPVVADVSADDGARHVAQQIADHGVVQAGFAAIGGWWEGSRLVDLDTQTWSSLLTSHLTAHFLAARATVPHLDPVGSAYVTLNGIATLQPEAGSGPVSVTGAGQSMLLDVLRAEDDRPAVRFHELCVVNPVVDDGDAADAPEAVVEISDVVSAALTLARSGEARTRRHELGRL
ncbi:SDR family oxidoreductase [Mumia sp. ZJ1417]|uniref:SDR family NAD(P)-dependent oxidoreductase n=1 Tax=unclassified Mumia TaxID=2621872 RepID=UPI00141DF503|nr:MULTISPECIES: SDR family oxidoreductase [unclassified Mumia]QMW67881.1 SDR family oxidoreductase [Mumia sp. ZJ1417]